MRKKHYLTEEGLESYDILLKEYIDKEITKAINKNQEQNNSVEDQSVTPAEEESDFDF